MLHFNKFWKSLSPLLDIRTCFSNVSRYTLKLEKRIAQSTKPYYRRNDLFFLIRRQTLYGKIYVVNIHARIFLCIEASRAAKLFLSMTINERMKIISITSGIISIKVLKREPRYIISVHKFALKRRNTREASRS